MAFKDFNVIYYEKWKKNQENTYLNYFIGLQENTRKETERTPQGVDKTVIFELI